MEYEKGGETPEKEMVEKLKEMQMTEGDKPQYLGALNFAVEYDPDKSALLVTIMSLSDLPPRDPSLGGCDPYIKLQLLPEKKHKCKTRVLRKTLNPVYDETFTFYGISFNQLQGITLHFVLLSFDRFSRDAIIGEVLYPLDPEEICQKQLTLSREITPRHLRVRIVILTSSMYVCICSCNHDYILYIYIILYCMSTCQHGFSSWKFQN